jgi:hypothetical protein
MKRAGWAMTRMTSAAGPSATSCDVRFHAAIEGIADTFKGARGHFQKVEPPAHRSAAALQR